MGQYKEVFMRNEIKYLISKKQYDALLERLENMVRVDEYGRTEIMNIYFDTDDYRLIRTSLDKPVYKEKMRLRTYGVPGDESNAFIEIKKKYNGVVYKRRISTSYSKAVDYLIEDRGLVHDDNQKLGEIEEMRHIYGKLKPAMTICYERVAMVGIEDPELRITFDSNIRWRTKKMDLKNGTYGRDIIGRDQYLMEIKIANSMSMELAKILSELRIFPVSISKYGRGYTDMIFRGGKSICLIIYFHQLLHRAV